MKAGDAVAFETSRLLKVVELDLDGPRTGELLVSSARWHTIGSLWVITRLAARKIFAAVAARLRP